MPVINSYNSENDGGFSPSSPNNNIRSDNSQNSMYLDPLKAKSQKTDEIFEQSHCILNQHHINIDFKPQITQQRSNTVITLDKHKGESMKSS